MASPPLDDPSCFDSMGSLPMGPLHLHDAPELPFSPPSPHSSSQYSANFCGIDDSELGDSYPPQSPDGAVSTTTIDALRTHFKHTPAQRHDFQTFFHVHVVALTRENQLTLPLVADGGRLTLGRLAHPGLCPWSLISCRDITALTDDLHTHLILHDKVFKLYFSIGSLIIGAKVQLVEDRNYRQ
ncbi:hypothetical protein JB92DRAFT_3117471 [Gautieria morchelliformis]|nr:hypothetical protein JB92DRAFT_3117471 [Gautieria morchelliformis]